ncbi:MAG: GTPase Era [Omnitrophica WOR_2 bacterium]
MEIPTDSPYKSGYVAVMGKPNTGKSTLINALLGQKIAAVSPRPQTTRRQQLGILTLENAQIVLVDTPGMHEPRHKLGETMIVEATEALEESDLAIFLVDASQEPGEEDRILASLFKRLKHTIPVILALNKTDLVSESELVLHQKDYLALLPQAIPVAISALQNINLGQLIETILTNLPEGAPLFPEDQLTDLYERDIAADLIREAALYHLKDEVPHGITVRVDEFTERNEHGAFIAATIFVERESHKAIVIGQGGSMLKKIGSDARKEIETMSGRKVFLQLRVKVRKNWRNDEKSLRQFGFGRKK